MLNRNRCSRSSGMGVHDGPEYAAPKERENYPLILRKTQKLNKKGELS